MGLLNPNGSAFFYYPPAIIIYSEYITSVIPLRKIRGFLVRHQNLDWGQAAYCKKRNNDEVMASGNGSIWSRFEFGEGGEVLIIETFFKDHQNKTTNVSLLSERRMRQTFNQRPAS